MSVEHVTIMIKGSVNDMFGEFSYFLKEVFPDVKKICNDHDIEIDYVDSFFSISDEDIANNRLILSNLNSIDNDRTLFICFRGQRLGWVPHEHDIDKLTLDVFPELVNYIGTISITDLSMLHAFKPFDKCIEGNMISPSPVKHGLFYFRNSNYVDNLNENQKIIYTNSAMGEDAEVPDMNIAKAKDIVCELKNEFESKDDCDTQIRIRHYDGIWDNNLKRNDLINSYTGEYAKLHGISHSELMKDYGGLFDDTAIGCFKDFKCQKYSLKDVIIKDIIESLKMEFPKNFS